MSDDERVAETTLLDLYKLSVEMADRVSARRSAANAFFLTVQTTFVALLGIVSRSLDTAPWWKGAIVTTPGIVLCVFWWLQLRGYRLLNQAKFMVIQELEKDLPKRPFTDEWTALKENPSPSRCSRYFEIGTLERVIPWVFACVYFLLFVGRTVG